MIIFIILVKEKIPGIVKKSYYVIHNPHPGLCPDNQRWSALESPVGCSPQNSLRGKEKSLSELPDLGKSWASLSLRRRGNEGEVVRKYIQLHSVLLTMTRYVKRKTSTVILHQRLLPELSE